MRALLITPVVISFSFLFPHHLAGATISYVDQPSVGMQISLPSFANNGIVALAFGAAFATVVPTTPLMAPFGDGLVTVTGPGPGGTAIVAASNFGPPSPAAITYSLTMTVTDTAGVPLEVTLHVSQDFCVGPSSPGFAACIPTPVIPCCFTAAETLMAMFTDAVDGMPHGNAVRDVITIDGTPVPCVTPVSLTSCSFIAKDSGPTVVMGAPVGISSPAMMQDAVQFQFGAGVEPGDSISIPVSLTITNPNAPPATPEPGTAVPLAILLGGATLVLGKRWPLNCSSLKTTE